MLNLPAAGELNKRVTINRWSDSPNAAFSLDQTFTAPIERRAKMEPVGAMAHYAAKQVSDTLTHRITVRQDHGSWGSRMRKQAGLACQSFLDLQGLQESPSFRCSAETSADLTLV